MALCTHCGSTGIKKLAKQAASGRPEGLCKPCAELLNRIAFNDWKPGDGKVGEAHPEDVGLLMELQEAGLAAAEFFDLPVRVIEHKRRPYNGGGRGICYISERRIGILIRYRNGSTWDPKRVPAGMMWGALAQQLAYFRYPRHHTTRCREFKREVAEWIQTFREDLTSG